LERGSLEPGSLKSRHRAHHQLHTSGNHLPLRTNYPENISSIKINSIISLMIFFEFTASNAISDISDIRRPYYNRFRMLTRPPTAISPDGRQVLRSHAPPANHAADSAAFPLVTFRYSAGTRRRSGGPPVAARTGPPAGTADNPAYQTMAPVPPPGQAPRGASPRRLAHRNQALRLRQSLAKSAG
jgi:hypothetical protein